MNTDRRALLRSAGHIAAFGTLAAALPRHAVAQEQGDAAVCLSMYYPNSAEASFDSAAWSSRHLPLLRRLYGDCVERIELRMFVPPPPAPRQRKEYGSPGSASSVPQRPKPPALPLIRAAVSIWIYDVKAFAERSGKAATEIVTDLSTITTLTPTVQYDRVAALLGDSRASVAVGSNVVSNYYVHKEGGRFDAAYYAEHIIPQMVKLYGEKAISRIEFCTGVRGDGGGKPPLDGIAHYYIRDLAAWSAVPPTALGPLLAEVPRFTDGTPLVSSMTVAAAG